MTIDEQIAILQAYNDGKKIERRSMLVGDSDYSEVTEKNHQFDFHQYRYRVNDKPNLRPYVSAEEFLNAQKQHGPYFKIENNPVHYYISHVVEDNGIDSISLGFCTFGFITDRCLWQDGTPCGIEEE